MSEAKRRQRAYDTLDGGPPSDELIAVQIDIFNPTAALLAMDDRPRLTTIDGMYARLHRHPLPLCSICDYRFSFGESPPLLFCLRPFIPKAEKYMMLTGAICLRCSDLSQEQLATRLMDSLHDQFPDWSVRYVDSGSA